MNKSELIEAIAKSAGLTKSQTTKAVNGFFDEVTKTLCKGDKVTIVGFGTFCVSKRKSREGRNPRTGGTIKIPSKTAPTFRAGKNLKDKVDSQ